MYSNGPGYTPRLAQHCHTRITAVALVALARGLQLRALPGVAQDDALHLIALVVLARAGHRVVRPTAVRTVAMVRERTRMLVQYSRIQYSTVQIVQYNCCIRAKKCNSTAV